MKWDKIRETDIILLFGKWLCVQFSSIEKSRENETIFYLSCDEFVFKLLRSKKSRENETVDGIVSARIIQSSLAPTLAFWCFWKINFRDSRKFTMNYRDMVNNEKDLRKLEVQPVQPTDPPTFPDNCVPLRRVRHVMLCYGLFGTVIVAKPTRNWKPESDVRSPNPEK